MAVHLFSKRETLVRFQDVADIVSELVATHNLVVGRLRNTVWRKPMQFQILSLPFILSLPLIFRFRRRAPPQWRTMTLCL